jgi:hypothetical protein
MFVMFVCLMHVDDEDNAHNAHNALAHDNSNINIQTKPKQTKPKQSKKAKQTQRPNRPPPLSVCLYVVLSYPRLKKMEKVGACIIST